MSLFRTATAGVIKNGLVTVDYEIFLGLSWTSEILKKAKIVVAYW